MGQLGLFLLRVVFWASNQLSRARDRPRDYVLVFAAHLSLAGVSVIGKVIDAFPSSRESRHRARASNEPSCAERPRMSQG
jgi:hypothetical protein